MRKGKKCSKLTVYNGIWWMDSVNKTDAKRIAAKQRRAEGKKLTNQFYKD